MRANELELVRKVLLWALALSALAAPRTYSAAPVPIHGVLVPFHTGSLVVLLVVLWRRWLRSDTVAALAGVLATVSANIVLHRTVDAIHAGTLPSEAVGNIITPTSVSVAGLAFVALRMRPALALALGNVAAAATTTYVAADMSTAVLGTASAVNALRFAVVAIVLFAVVGTIAARRAAERDHAEQEEAAAEQRAANLEEIDRLRDRLFMQAAHELKTPLAVLRTAIETLHDKRDQLSEDQVEEITATMWRMMERLQNRTEAVLDVNDLGRMRDADGNIVRAREAAGCLRDALATTADVLGARELAVDLPDGGRIAVDRDRLEHVLENLLSNAAKYSPPGTPVAVRSTVSDNEVIVTVTDMGTSLRGEDATRIFETGVRTSEARSRADGSGVGLAVVERYVRDWGGRVWCKPTPTGTTFGFSIPRTDAVLAVH